ncbi:PucR family transcriptional regulator ligand-binding domain-containing protein [Thermoactinomyces sp. CICC 10521]|nr:PucR family transcriptional regulator ligand-binding domain-containing protein [Thermoactinomyces sp. CICC 10523]MBH8604344.1 PucR family transcriptional regulator ligand-binding domain-containing protein [Thermoactinomyces sp. CICC 10522]MBH8607798.1 PucR family transcriptional regulator ligand-binding domain-containing protein [Thermoactinomyces sp. CICC 10521]
MEPVLTVRDVLNRPVFKNAEVIAGKKGLNRRIRWVHILEVSEFGSLINGEEMILSTGITFQSSAASPASYLKRLIDQNASCLCLEFGYYFHSVPPDLIEIADRHDFPLIIFREEIRFVDITQDLHSIIINRHYHMLQNLEALSREFHRLTLKPNGTYNILHMLYEKTKSPIIFLPVKGKPLLVPEKNSREQEELFCFLRERLNMNGGPGEPESRPRRFSFREKKILVQPVKAMGQIWAHIGMICNREPHRYDDLILDWSSLAIAQDLLRKRYIEERRLHFEHVWVDDLLQRRIEEEQLHSHLGMEYNKLKGLNSIVCLIEFGLSQEPEPLWDLHEFIRYDFSLMTRSVFEQYHFRVFITMNNGLITVIAFDLRPDKPWKTRLQQAVKQIQKADLDRKQDLQLNIGVGRPYPGFTGVHHSYKEANQVLMLNSEHRAGFLFHEELGIFQLLLNLKDSENVLPAFVERYLGPLIAYDRDKGSDLLHTLKVYLDYDCSKKLAAEHLFIARQSLYYRLEKIKELLGEDVMSPENKLVLNVALRACKLLYPDRFNKDRAHLRQTGEH